MTERLWYELGQVKHNHFYCVFLLARQREQLNWFNIVVLVFSSGGMMGYQLWKEIPLVACIIVAIISLLKLISPHIIPSEKQLDKLDSVADFYFDYFNKLEQLWFDFDKDRITELELQNKFYTLKDLERETNKKVNEIVKRTIKTLATKADTETRQYLKLTYNTE
jgi:hypothetical protein